jgi:membrane associated rhomboid family serine protease
MAVPPSPPSGPGVETPTCYRHPGRETYVSCVRCGRPACPDCLRQAAVGQQCVDCIKAANRTSRPATGMFGGRVSATPVVTYTLIALNVVAYIAESIYPNLVNYGAVIGRATDPQLHEVVGVAVGDWYRLLSNAFLHEPLGTGFGITHILFNMWALYVLGPALERFLGQVRFLAVYLVSALAGSVFFYLIAPVNQGAIGASGAIFGLFGAWFVLSRRLRLDARMIVFLIAINLVLGFTIHGIGWQAHIGGLIAGAALTAAYVYAPRANRTAIQVGATVALVALLIVGVVIRDQQLVHSVIVRF